MNQTELQRWDDFAAIEEGMLQDIEIAEHNLYDLVLRNKPHIKLTADGAFYSDLGDRFARVGNSDLLRGALNTVERAFVANYGEPQNPIVGAWD